MRTSDRRSTCWPSGRWWSLSTVSTPWRQAVTKATRQIGEPPPKRFVGHLTLARLKRHAHAPRALGALVGADFDVDEIALVQSRLHPDGARYETLRTWPAGR